jgi:hypothetical protein
MDLVLKICIGLMLVTGIINVFAGELETGLLFLIAGWVSDNNRVLNKQYPDA